MKIPSLGKCKSSEQAIHCLVVALASVVPHLLSLPKEYIYDDVGLIQTNFHLQQISSFKDCLSFFYQPTRPVANFILALTNWLGHGNLVFHYSFSLLLHALTAMLIYLNLVQWARRRCGTKSNAVALGAALFFAVMPIHIQAIRVIQFRSEILATLFTLVAMSLSQCLAAGERIDVRAYFQLIGLCLGIALACWCKEVFAVVAPVAVLAISAPESGFRAGMGSMRRALLTTATMASGLASGAWLLWASRLDGSSFSPHGMAVGVGMLPLKTQVILAARTTLEGFWKIFSGQDLTNLRILLRGGLGSRLGLYGAGIIHAATILAGAMLIRGGGFYRVTGICLGVSLAIYLLIPNLNIGSEHYWYFTAIPVAALCAYALDRIAAHRRTVTRYGLLVILACYGIFLVCQIENREAELQDRHSEAVAGTVHFPESAESWVNLAAESVSNGDYESTRLALQKAKAIDPYGDATAWETEFVYYYYTGQIGLAARMLQHMVRTGEVLPHALASYFALFADLAANTGDCGGAAEALNRAARYDAASPLVQQSRQHFLDLKASGTLHCQAPSPDTMERS